LVQIADRFIISRIRINTILKQEGDGLQ